MAKSLVGKAKNSEFAFFWLLIGGSIGNIIVALYSPYFWAVFLLPAALSILIAIMMAGKKQRPKLWLCVDLVLTAILLILLVPFLGTAGIMPASFPTGMLIILGCILGIMDW